MRRSMIFGFAMAGLYAGVPPASVAQTPASTTVPADVLPMVPAAKPGVYSQQTVNPTRFRLTVTGKTFTSREAIEKYLAYRAAELTLQQKGAWFTLVENRSKGDSEPLPAAEPGKHYSFRMAYWRPVWRYKTDGAASWSTWSPFSGTAFFADGKDPKTVTEFEVGAEIIVGKGLMDDMNPLAFEPRALSEFLVNQVSPPE